MTDYFVIEQTTTRSTPFLNLQDGSQILAKRESAPANVTLTFSAMANLQPEPAMVDYHVISRPACSQALRDVIDPFLSDDIEWVPATGTIHDVTYEYWILHAIKRLDVIDKTASEIEWDGERIDEIESLVLDQAALDALGPERTQVFELEGSPDWLVSAEVAKAMQDSGCKGFALIPTDEWDSDSDLDL